MELKEAKANQISLDYLDFHRFRFKNNKETNSCH